MRAYETNLEPAVVAERCGCTVDGSGCRRIVYGVLATIPPACTAIASQPAVVIGYDWFKSIGCSVIGAEGWVYTQAIQ
jgi:hypothetical protein